MSRRSIATMLFAGALALALSAGAAAAQSGNQSPVMPIKPTVTSKPGSQSAATRKAPGRTCGEFMSNSQAHKDCVARQAKMDNAAKGTKKLKAEKAPKKS